MKKIAFLFGAGAEGYSQLNLPSGKHFKRDIILARDVDKLYKAIVGPDTAKSSPLPVGPIIKHNSTSVLYQTMAEGSKDDLQRLFPDENDRQIATEYIEHKHSSNKVNSGKDEGIYEAFRKLYKEKFYDAIQDITEKDFPEYISYFLDNAGFYSFLDSLFNCLRLPQVYPKEISRIIKLYYAAYKSILDGMLKALGERADISFKKTYEKILKGELEEGADNRKFIADFVEYLQFEISRLAKDKQLYYSIIKKYLAESNEFELFGVTLNYTNFAQKIIGIEENHMCYLHGKLDLFESLRTKHIDKLSGFEKDDIVFPYLLVQSGIKPIISPFQIEEFHKAVRASCDADYFIVLGYGVNPDDEHISNILRERLRSKKIIYFIHDDTDENRQKLLHQPGFSTNIIFHKTSEFEEVISQITNNTYAK